MEKHYIDSVKNALKYVEKREIQYFKKSHLNLHELRQDVKKSIVPQLFNDHSEGYSCCVDGCKNKRSENHLFSRSWLKDLGIDLYGNSKDLCFENYQKFYLLNNDKARSSGYNIYSTGMKNTSTFNEFCSKHDNLFSYIDCNRMIANVDDNKYINYLTLRSLLYLDNKIFNDNIFANNVNDLEAVENLPGVLSNISNSLLFLIEMMKFGNKNSNDDKKLFEYKILRVPNATSYLPHFFVNYSCIHEHTIVTTGITHNKELFIIISAIPYSNESYKYDTDQISRILGLINLEYPELLIAMILYSELQVTLNQPD